jgi:transposase
VRRLRRAWLERVAAVPAEALVFVDESGANAAMTRTRGRAPPGERVVGRVPHGHWTTLTMLGALRLAGVVAAATVPSATDTPVFASFVAEALVPALRAGDVVVWDNLSPHKAAGLEGLLASAGASVMPLPPYSPDLSPIEPCWSKVKQFLRAAGARDEVALGEAAQRAFASVTAADARGWFRACGYCVH